MVDDLSFALEISHDDKVFSLGEDVEEEFDYNKYRRYIEIHNWRWYREDLGSYSCDFPAPSLLKLINAAVSGLLKEYSKINNQDDNRIDIIAPHNNSDVILGQSNNDLSLSTRKFIESSI